MTQTKETVKNGPITWTSGFRPKPEAVLVGFNKARNPEEQFAYRNGYQPENQRENQPPRFKTLCSR